MNEINKILGDVKSIIDLEPQIFLDYDGTLVPIRNDPSNCYADSELDFILKYLDKYYELFIVTGRSLDDLIKFIGNYNIVALHGDIYYINGEVIETCEFQRYVRICNKLYENRHFFTKKYKNLKIFNKTGGLLFHLGDVHDGNEINEIIEEVKKISREVSMDVYRGKNIVELRMPGINKGTAIKKIRNTNRPAIIIGDDITDEEAFENNKDAITIKVGSGKTSARYNVEYKDVREILIDIINLR